MQGLLFAQSNVIPTPICLDLEEVGGSCGDWMELAQDRDRWRALVAPSGSKNAGNFLTSCRHQVAFQERLYSIE